MDISKSIFMENSNVYGNPAYYELGAELQPIPAAATGNMQDGFGLDISTFADPVQYTTMECPVVTESLMPLESMDSIEAQQQTTLAPIDIFTTPLTTCVSSPYSNDNNQVDVNKAMAGQKDPNLAWMSDPETFNAVESITTGGVIPTTVQPLLAPTASPSGMTSPIKPGSTLNYIPEDDMSEGTITSPPSPTSSIGTCSDGGSGSDGTYDPPSPFFINDQTYVISRKTKSQRRSTRTHPQLWEFLLNTLNDPRYNPTHIKWEDKEKGVFKFVQNQKVAKLWGDRGQRAKHMNYEFLSRALRHYYKKKIVTRITSKRLTYRFGDGATNWKERSHSNN